MEEKMPRHLLPEYLKLLRRPEYSGRTALIMKELDYGNYDWAEIARRGDTTPNEKSNWWVTVENIIDGVLPGGASAAWNQARAAKWPLNALDITDELRGYLCAHVKRLAAINPEIEVDKPAYPGTLRSRAEWERQER